MHLDSSPRRWLRPLLASLAGALWLTAAVAAPQSIQVLNQSGQPMAGAAVSVHVKNTSTKAPPGTTADMAQRNKAFAPGLLIVQTGTAVNFPNFDTVRHHVYSFSPIKKFEIKLYVGTPAKPVIFDKPGTATLGCNIHDRMLGYIHVVDTPYFGVTDDKGRVNIEVPAGEHLVRVWHPSQSESQPGIEMPLRTGSPAVIRVSF